MDITNRINRLEKYEKKYDIELNSLFAKLIKDKMKDSYILILNGEIHSLEKDTLDGRIKINFKVYDQENNLMGKFKRIYAMENFFKIKVFHVLMTLKSKPSIIRIYPEKIYPTQKFYAPKNKFKFNNNIIKTKVVGITFNNRENKIRNLNYNDSIFLKRDYENEYDNNAIKVVSKIGDILGYLPKELAFKLAPKFDKKQSFEAKIYELPKDDNNITFKIEIYNKKG
ncbi:MULTISPECIES: HIRAN domain-containing protein [Halanaerobium]|uniref:HIRAN domain-containing protein n=1 Tax=Halanaerobium saccharolyticum TaxID=43595 RepID=A0A4R6LMI6_9FIRM|nr:MULTISPECIES: HIRAN domain-containing protein [Halanaerobium]RCW60160.1 HIRAN domain-containing protein [Halanaerobium sp. ST460_2HS_T2]TDO86459.1 HIRAN domain-containing protein [Halanaerobium saccharolyticum]